MPRLPHAFDLTDRVALVTGAGANGGIGHAIALGLAEAGAAIVAADRDREGAETTAAEVRTLGRRALAVPCDFARIEEIEALYHELDTTFGRLDILVNNVGTNIRTRPESATLDQVDSLMRLNVVGTWRCTQLAGQRMFAGGRGGSIINIASTAGASALGRGNVVFSMTKAAMLQMTRELAVEWARHGIRVNAILPTQTLVPSMRQFLSDSTLNGPRFKAEALRGIPLQRLAEPEDMVGPAVFLASDAAAFVTGVWLPVDGGNLAFNAGGTLHWDVDAQGRIVWED